jgi:VIT1/CCC1 family predicted Fe2+/Mn2+ transporter
MDCKRHQLGQDHQPVCKLIGAAEILAALGLILPAVFGIAPVLVPLAALGLVLIMLGAVIVHARRKEPQPIVVNVVLLVLAAVIVWGRFGPSKEATAPVLQAWFR